MVSTDVPLWRHRMEIFSVLLALCEGNPTVTGGFPSQRLAMQSFGVYFDLHPKKRLSKQSRRRLAHYDVTVMWAHDFSTSSYSAEHQYPALRKCLWLLKISNTYLLITWYYSIWPTRSLEISRNLKGLFNQPFEREKPPVTSGFPS